VTATPASPSPGSQGIGLGGATLTLPAGWHTATFNFSPNPFAQAVVFFGPGVLKDPCPSQFNCGVLPPDPLAPDSMVGGIYAFSVPGKPPFPTSGPNLYTVRGQTLIWSSAVGMGVCGTPDGDESVTVVAPVGGDGSILNWEELHVCISGPDAAAGDAMLRRMLGLPSGAR